MTILELFASLVPRRMQILSPGDGLEGHFQAIFRPCLVWGSAHPTPPAYVVAPPTHTHTRTPLAPMKNSRGKTIDVKFYAQFFDVLKAWDHHNRNQREILRILDPR